MVSWSERDPRLGTENENGRRVCETRKYGGSEKTTMMVISPKSAYEYG
ncbi:hypothetical protein SAMN05428984_4016 [Sphingomonas sp. OK281]|nr:hypothetical protein SAMN05428984_4016 [Sphingomonas sp. OK281]